MNDTPEAIERKFRRMLIKRPGAERLKMGCSMHATARALVKASISQQHPGARPAELKRLFFLHFYSTDFEPEKRNRIASALAKSSRRSEAQEKGRPMIRKPVDLANLAIANSDAVREQGETYNGKRKGRAKRPRRRSR